MAITEKQWVNFINRLSKIDTTAGQKVKNYIEVYGLDDPGLLQYAFSVANRYGEAAGATAAEWYDEIAAASGKLLPPAELADMPTFEEVAKAVNGTKKTGLADNVANAITRIVKMAGIDTTMQNAIRDGAEWAWVPHGDSCAFCITLASNGWQLAKKEALKGHHAKHVHANCDCTYAIRFDGKPEYENYNPDQYLDIYENAEGYSSDDKINYIRRMKYQVDKDRINALKRANYAQKKNIQLSQHKKGNKVNITEQAIKNIRAIGPSYLSQKEKTLLQEMNRKILSISKKSNESNEVAIALVDGVISNPVLGDQYGVKVLKDPEMYHLLKGKNIGLHTVTISHNHPGLSYFSLDDLSIFFGSPNIKTMEVVTNTGKTWFISKKSKYNDVEVYKKYIDIIAKNKNKSEREVVAEILKSLYNEVERNK